LKKAVMRIWWFYRPLILSKLCV